MAPQKPLLRYKIRKKIGTGGMASVYLALDTVLNREVAIKMVHPHLLHQSETMRRFSNEAQAIAQLSHENIIKIFDFGVESRPYIVMELINGSTLADCIAREGALPSVVTIEIAFQVLSALSCAHKKGIFHRDIKPANILIDHDGCLRITDFGIAYLVNSESVTLTGALVGSPNYISPEQMSGGTITGTTDIFSLGIVLYQCCTGMPPFDADSPHGVINAILHSKAVPACERNRRVLLQLSDIIDTCLEKDARLRPSADEMLQRLTAICNDNGIACGKHRLAAFLHDPAGAGAAELTELHTLFIRKARSAIAHRQQGSALRAFEQAARLKALSSEDQKLERSVSRRIHAAHVVSNVCAALVALGLALVVAYVIYCQFCRDRRSAPGSETATAVVAVATRVPPPPENVTDTIPRHPSVPMGPLRSGNPPSVTARKNAAPGLADRHAADKQHFHGTTSDVLLTSAVTVPPVASGYGFVRCLTNPPWVTISVDNIERGKTPTLSLLSLSAGPHELRLSKPRFADFHDTFTIAPAETTTLRIRLVPFTEDSLQR
jgi:eukaryotic-like serine/threonine-protein kinase